MKKIEKEKIKTWFVTGASSGIGHELCAQLLDRGYNVIAIARRMPEFKHENALCLSADVTKPETIKEAAAKGIERFKTIDVLSNNAGISSYLTFEEEPEDEMRSVMETNYWGTYNTCREMIPLFRKQGYGAVINMSSECGLIPRSFGAAYCSSKYAVEGLTSVLWLETQKFCRVMTVELSYFENTEIGKNKPRGTQYEEYKDIPVMPVKFIRNYFNNDLKTAVKCIIDEAEKEKPQRRLMLGRDIICKADSEIKSLERDKNLSKRRAYSCARLNKEFFKKILKKIFRF